MKHQLTRTETKVVRLISLGCTTRQVASVLGMPSNTADNHRWHAMQKLGVHTMAALTRMAIDQGITSLSDRLTDEELAKASLCSRIDPSQGIDPPTQIDQSEEADAEDDMPA